MTELKNLKTLNDFRGFMCRDHDCKLECHKVEYKRIRDAAIEWLKYDIENYRKSKIYLPKGNQGIAIHNFIVETRQFWKNRFNITDKELSK